LNSNIIADEFCYLAKNNLKFILRHPAKYPVILLDIGRQENADVVVENFNWIEYKRKQYCNLCKIFRVSKLTLCLAFLKKVPLVAAYQ